MNILVSIGSIAAVVGSISGGIYFYENRFETKIHHEVTLAENEKRVSDHLLDLRIDLYESRLDRLIDKKSRQTISPREQRIIKRLNKSLDILYKRKEEK